MQRPPIMQPPPVMQRPLLRQAGFVIGLLWICPAAFGQLPASGESTPAPANQPAPGNSAPSNSPLGGGPLGPLTQPVTPGGPTAPGVGGSLAIQEPAPSGGPELPSGYQPPGAAPAIMTNIPDPRRTEAAMDATEAEMRGAGNRGITSILISGDPSDENKELLAKWAQLQVDRMAAAKSKQEISNIGRNISTKLLNAASQQSNPNREREFREAMVAALTKELRDVLLNSNFYVRAQAAAILGDLNVMEAPVRGDDPPEAYTPAISALLDLLEQTNEDPETNEALTGLKVLAARGIQRLARYSPSMDANLRYRAAEVMIKELAKPDTNFWYQVRLAEALAAIELDVDRRRKPVVITALMSVIADETRHCEARAAAAKALSRTPIPAGQFDEEAAATEILAMAREFALNYNKSPSDLKWRYCFWKLALAFEVAPTEDSSQLAEDSLLRSGTLPAAYQTIQERVAPVIDFVLSQKVGTPDPQPIPNELLQPLNQPLATKAAAASTN